MAVMAVVLILSSANVFAASKSDVDELPDLEIYDDYESVLEGSSSSDILSALENMPGKYKMVIKLSYVYEFDDEYIAKTIDVQTNSVRMYKTRALRMLADRLKGSEYCEK
jgi:DNA-directed RNA polymerase specialized sigma24 family protein